MKNDPLADAIKGHYEGITADRLRHRMANRGRKRAVFLSAGAVTAALALLLLLAMPRELSAQEILDLASKSLNEVGLVKAELQTKAKGGGMRLVSRYYIDADQTLAILVPGGEKEHWFLNTREAQYSWVPGTDTLRRHAPTNLWTVDADRSVLDIIYGLWVGPVSSDLSHRQEPELISRTEKVEDGSPVYVLTYQLTTQLPEIPELDQKATTSISRWVLRVDKHSGLPLSVEAEVDGHRQAYRIQFSYGGNLNEMVKKMPSRKAGVDVEKVRSEFIRMMEKAKEEREHITAAWRCPNGLLFIAWHQPVPKHLKDDQGRTWVRIRPFQSEPGPSSALFICETGKYEPQATFEGLEPTWQDKEGEWPIEARAFDVGIQLVEAAESAPVVLDFWRKQHKPPSE